MGTMRNVVADERADRDKNGFDRVAGIRADLLQQVMKVTFDLAKGVFVIARPGPFC